jgi:hypothetical protein
MGLLKSVNNVPDINYYDYRDDDYYGKYKFRVRFSIQGVRYAMYEKTFDELMKRYNATTGWRQIRKQDRDSVTENLESLRKFIELRNSFKENATGTVRVENNSISIFSNDLSLLKSAEDIKSDIYYDYTQVQTSNFVGVKSFVKDPKHKFRVYFKAKRIENDFVKQLGELVKTNKGLYPSPALKAWLIGTVDTNSHSWNWRYRYSNPNHFIDYDEESTLSYLALMHGEFLGKRYKLEKRPEPI